MTNDCAIRLDPHESARFGFTCARATNVDGESIERMLGFCLSNNVRLLTARCDTANAATIHRLEDAGCRLMDTQINYRLRGAFPQISDHAFLRFRDAEPADEAVIGSIALKAFVNHVGHYNADARLDQLLIAEGYSEWARRTCSDNEAADVVILAEQEGQIVGFGAMRLSSEQESSGVMFAVDPATRGKGIARLLFIKSLEWSLRHGRTVSSHFVALQNYPIQRVLVGLGFKPEESVHTFHKWMD